MPLEARVKHDRFGGEHERSEGFAARDVGHGGPGAARPRPAPPARGWRGRRHLAANSSSAAGGAITTSERLAACDALADLGCGV